MSIDSIDQAKHPKWKTFLYYAAFICLMLAGFLMVFSMRSKKSETPDTSDSGISGAAVSQVLVLDRL